MKIKKSTIVLIVVALLYLAQTTVNYFRVIESTKEVKEQYMDINISK